MFFELEVYFVLGQKLVNVLSQVRFLLFHQCRLFGVQTVLFYFISILSELTIDPRILYNLLIRLVFNNREEVLIKVILIEVFVRNDLIRLALTDALFQCLLYQFGDL